MNPWNSIPNIGEGRARTAMPEHGAPYGTPGSKVNIAPLLRPAPEVIPEVTSQEDEALPAVTADEMRGAEGMSDQMNWAFDQATHDMHVRVAAGMADLADQMDGVFKPKGDDAHRDVPFTHHPNSGLAFFPPLVVTRRNHRECEWLYNPWTGATRCAEDVKDDPTGLMLRPPGWPVFAAGDGVTDDTAAVAAGASILAGMKVTEVSTLPPGEMHFLQGGKLVDRIVNVAPPHDSLEEAQMAAGWPQEAQPATVLSSPSTHLSAWFDASGTLHGSVSDEQLVALCRNAIAAIERHNGWFDEMTAAMAATPPDSKPTNPKDAVGDTPLRRQEGGAHYKSMKIQPVEYIHANGIGYFEGNVVKYVSRWRAKGGLQDLKKARHYLDLLIEMEGGAP